MLSPLLTQRLRAMAFGLAAFSCYADFAQAQTNKLVGYLPTWRNMAAISDATDFTKLTHINIAFLNPTSSGAVANGANSLCMSNSSGSGNVSAAELAYVVNKAHAAGAKVLISLGGGAIPNCSGNWQTLLGAGQRQNLVNNLVQFVNAANLDGIDVDLEGGLLTDIDNAGNYTPFIQALRNSLPAGKLVTAATASYEGGMIPVSSIPYFDFVGLMSYDAIGPNWGSAGSEHSPYANAASDVNLWLSRGLPKSKLILGVPFYGYGFNGMPSDISFADILAQYGAGAAQNDVIGNRCSGCAYITYNGIPTIRAKTQLAKQQGGGVMVWELSQDATGNNNLISVIRSELGSSGSSSSSSATCPDWVSGTNYYTGNIVRYQGGYYIAKFDNPGYIPTVSTYFWAPTNGSSCSGGSSSSSAPAFTKLIQAEAYSYMAGVQLEATSDTGGGQNVGWIDAGDWMAYASVSFPTSGTYRVEYRVASVSGSTLSLDLNAGSIQLGQVSVPATGGWQNWTTVTQTVTINAGTYNLGVFAPAGGWNLNWLRFTKL